MIEWIALAAVVIFIAIGLIGNRLRVKRLEKEGKPDTQLADIDAMAREKLKSISPSQTIKHSRAYSIINRALPFGNKEKTNMEETKQEAAQPASTEPELYVAEPKPHKIPKQPRGEFMRLYYKNRNQGETMKQFSERLKGVSA
jgi:hypothetical protein